MPSAVGQIVLDVNGSPPLPDPDTDGFLSPCDSCDFIANDSFERGRSARSAQVCDAAVP